MEQNAELNELEKEKQEQLAIAKENKFLSILLPVVGISSNLLCAALITTSVGPGHWNRLRGITLDVYWHGIFRNFLF